MHESQDQLRQLNEQLEREIAEHKLARSALQQSEERYRSILNASPDDITITDREGRIVMMSRAAVAIFGYERPEQGLGRSVTEFIAPPDRARAMAQVAARLQGIAAGPAEYVGLRADGSCFPIEVNSDFIRDAGGTPTGMVIIVRDISQRKQAEAERLRLEEQNQRLQKAESLSRMAAAIAHNFNNQLHSVNMGLELALGHLPRDTAAARDLTVALQAGRKAADMSKLMLTYLGQTAAARETLDLSEACSQSLAVLRTVMPEPVVLMTSLPKPGPTILADPNQIQQILGNLMANAWEATGKAVAAIQLTVKTVPAADIPPLRRFPADSEPANVAHACLEVTDAGCGIPSHDIEKVFDPFFSTKFAGRGLGLAVVLGLVRALDGVITVDSEPGRGSVFRVYLPTSAGA